MSIGTLDSEEFLNVPKRKTSSMGQLPLRTKPSTSGHPPFTSTQSLIPDRMQLSENTLAERKVMRQKMRKPKIVVVKSEQKAVVYPYVKRIASTSNVHGLKEMMGAKTIQARVFWILVCAVCTIMATYEIAMIVNTYNNDRIATKMSFEQQDVMQYPTILLCPTHWLSKKKLEKYKIPRNTLRYVFHYLGDALSVDRDDGWAGGQEPWDDFDHDLEEEVLRKTLKKHNWKSVAEMFQKISINFFDQTLLSFKTTLCSCCKQPKTVKATLSGACAKIELCASSFQTYNLPNIIHMKTEDRLGNISTTTPSETGKDIGAFVWIFDNRSQIGIQSHNSIFVQENWAYVLKMYNIQVSRKSIGNGKKRCKKLECNEKYLPMTDCEFKCVDKIRNYICFNCSKFSFFEENPQKRQCHKSKLDSTNGIEDFGGVCVKNNEKGKLLHEYVRAEMEECKRKCIQPCTQSYYEVSSVLRTHKTESMIQVRFYFENFAATIMRDVETLTIDTLISSIGGQTGLWLGASVVSVCQIISYCCCPCLHWKDIKKGYSGFRSTFRVRRKKAKNQNNNETNSIKEL